MVTYVFGHKNPDTDSVTSAIVYSNFLKSKGVDAKPIILSEINNETKFILEKWGVDTPELIPTLEAGSKIILVDHNERKQTIDNFEELEVVEVVDHHRFNFVTEGPVKIRADTVACTQTILNDVFKEAGYEIPETDSKLMVSAILSDTLLFKSPTTTDRDKVAVEEINKIAKIDDIESYAMDMFNAKSDLGDIPAKEVVQYDYKEFDFNGNKYAIGVLETTSPAYALGRKTEIIEAMKELQNETELKGILLSVIDIIEESNKTIIISENDKEMLLSLFDGSKEVEENVLDLGRVLSRKKEIAPKIDKFFA